MNPAHAVRSSRPSRSRIGVEADELAPAVDVERVERERDVDRVEGPAFRRATT